MSTTSTAQACNSFGHAYEPDAERTSKTSISGPRFNLGHRDSALLVNAEYLGLGERVHTLCCALKDLQPADLPAKFGGDLDPVGLLEDGERVDAGVLQRGRHAYA